MTPDRRAIVAGIALLVFLALCFLTPLLGLIGL